MRQFAAYVEEGSKFHTIRATRKQPPRVGEVCHCYVDPRQKTMRLLRRSPCTRVQDIHVLQIGGDHHSAPDLSIAIDGLTLSRDEANEFAWRDGFRPVRRCDALIAMGHLWRTMHPTVFTGHLIWWDPAITEVA
jgi:hypothetical protein